MEIELDNPFVRVETPYKDASNRRVRFRTETGELVVYVPVEVLDELVEQIESDKRRNRVQEIASVV